MAFEYFLYDTRFENTLVDRSDKSFAPFLLYYNEIYTDFFIPKIQPVYFYRENYGRIVLNKQEIIDKYIDFILSSIPPTHNDYIRHITFNIYSGNTIALINNKLPKTVFGIYTGVTRTELNLTITGTTNLGNGNFIAEKSGRNIAHKSISGGTLVLISNTQDVISICSSQYDVNNYFYAEKANAEATICRSCQMYLSGTPWIFDAGKYSVDFSAVIGNIASNGCTFAQFTIDETVQGKCFLERKQIPNYTTSLSLSRDIELTAGCHCLAIYYWAGASTACINYGMIRAKRIY